MNITITNDILHLLNCANAMEKKIREKYPTFDSYSHLDCLSDINACVILCDAYLNDLQRALATYAIAEWTETSVVVCQVISGRLSTNRIDISQAFN
jgi:hypothetical protein